MIRCVPIDGETEREAAYQYGQRERGALKQGHLVISERKCDPHRFL
jgi:hypothetical protein